MALDWYQTRRYVLRQPDGERQVETFARSLNWVKVSDTPEDRSAGVSRQVVWQALDVASIHYIEDAVFRRGYYVLMGAERRVVDALAAQAEAELSPWAVDELIEICHEADGLRQLGSAAILLSLAAPPEFDKRVYSIIESLLMDEEPAARGAALWMTLYAKYREFVPLLERIADGDPVDWIRDRAIHVLGIHRDQEHGS